MFEANIHAIQLMGRHCGLQAVPLSKLAIMRTLSIQTWTDFDPEHETFNNYGVIINKFDLPHSGTGHHNGGKRFVGDFLAVVGIVVVWGFWGYN